MVKMKLCLALALGVWCAACGGSTVEAPTARQQGAVIDETLEGHVCIDTYRTKEEIDKCRAAVKAKYDAKQAAIAADGGA